ncbi:MAG: SIMPL domain-containing protein [Bacteroidales bacterium]|nr:SIMPL domain-containing protein [Bacteroidales bacterium]
MEQNLKGKAITAAAVVIAGLMLPLSVGKFRSYERTVDVKGLCEKELKADKAIWPLTYKVVGNDLSQVLEETDRSNEEIRNFLIQGGIKDEEISVTAPQISDKYASEYGNNDRVYRYLVTNIITVCTADIDVVLALNGKLPELMKKGIAFVGDDWQNRTQFNFENLNSVKPAMIEEATANAREAARKFAQDSDSRLGKIKKATQGSFSISDRDSNTPYIKKVRVVTNIT